MTKVKESKPKKVAKEVTSEVKRGRPVVKNSARQAKLAKWEKLKAEGVTIKPGRPKSTIEKPAKVKKVKAEPVVKEIKMPKNKKVKVLEPELKAEDVLIPEEIAA